MSDTNSIEGIFADSTGPYIIAEAGVNYLGRIDLAKVFIEEAAAAGADAIKFQTHIPEAEMSAPGMESLDMEDLYERMSEQALSIEEHRTLQQYCQSKGIDFLSTPFSPEAVKLLDEIDTPAYKIGSGEVTNYHILKIAAKTGKPLLVSTGMHSMSAIEDAAEFISQYTDRVAFFYCVSEYPTPIENVNLGAIQEMKDALNAPIGFSDHTQGIEASVVALAQGADIIEKHFTIDRRLPGGDQEVSIEPDELGELVEYANVVVETRGNRVPPTETEAGIAEWARHSIVSKTVIPQGAELTESNITTKRPGTGIPASEFFEILGKTTTTQIEADSIIDRTDLE
ncbi:N-acetylneuraminate synthase family protein [Halorubrum salsamenti]|uniref:N-acetylneuraminate synthase family protein n=1 Tax=Halorubrum salsamenti TaxID=2583990 RepID=UPI0011AAAD2E|nr:N-acetylneuraminate synthase family protein [Halorubrum salsamenti]